MGFSAMYVGSTGMISHGDKMQVISNNLANVSTTGFKASRAHFGTLMSTELATANSTRNANDQSVGKSNQIGMGVQISAVLGDFRQGSFEGGAAVTDLAIGGQGYFRVDDPAGNQLYTRAGNFRFDNEGTLRNPQGYVLQGYAFDRDTGLVGDAAEDIILPSESVTLPSGQTVNVTQSEPEGTGSVDMVVNVNSISVNNSQSSGATFFSLLQDYNGSLDEPLDESLYEYRTNLRIYDDAGTAHNLNVYFDQTNPSNETRGRQHWEYIVAVDPSSDQSALAGTSAAGLLMSGVLEFNPAGELIGNTAFTMTNTDASQKNNLSNWGLASFTDDGQPAFTATLGANGAGAGTKTIGMNFGVTSSIGAWQGGPTTAGAVGNDTDNLAQLANADVEALRSTAFASSSTSLYQDQDGYERGFLNTLAVDEEGFLIGYFDNSQSEKLFQVALYDFTNEWGLERQGGNMFSHTPEAGAIVEGRAGEEQFGTISQNTLEGSNVDMATEFTDMILTQRGFQANSKVITTTDEILKNLIQVKR